jgi:glycosyltransferase involved in cell wall biosynthesis
MKISIIIPCYNKGGFVGHAIQSVLDQSYPDCEVVVIDDGSDDESWSVIRSFSSEVQAVRQKNYGACHARNRGANIASGEGLLFLDADDVLTPGTLSALSDTLREADGGIAACPWNYLSWDGEKWSRELSTIPLSPPGGDFIRGWLTGWFIPPCALLWKREAYENTGGWDEDLVANQDGDLILRALLNGVSVVQSSRGEALWRNFNNTRQTSKSRVRSVDTALSRARVIEKIIPLLDDRGQLDQYASEIGQNLHRFAQRGFNCIDDASASQRRRLEEITRKAWEIAGTDAVTGSLAHQAMCCVIGLRRKEALANWLAQFGIGSRIRRRRDQ